MKTAKLRPKASQDLEDIWFCGYLYFGEKQSDKYIHYISDIFRILVKTVQALRDLIWVNISMPSLSNGISFIPCRLMLTLLLSVY